jgi:hypothetical protein
MTRIAIAVSVFLCALALHAKDGYAGNGFSMIGAGCVPDGDTVANAMYKTGSMSTYFANGKTGTIRLFCPITAIDGGNETWHGMRIGYKDPDGMATAYRVRALLYYIPYVTFAGRTLITTCDSNTSNSTGYTSLFCDFPAFGISDFEMYWVEVIIDRTSTAAMPEFGGVHISEWD